MKLSDSKEMQIMPIKKLYSAIAENQAKTGTIAILCSRNNPDLKMLDHLDAYLIIEADDTQIENSRYSFRKFHGEHVRNFLQENKDFKKLYVCCDSGESRSTALGAAILRYFGRSDKEIWKNPYFHPNMLVYQKQLLTFGIKSGKIKMMYLKYINSKALNRYMKER